MPLEALTDEELMLQVQRDDRASYQVLFDRHRASLYGYLLRRSGDAELAAEVFQDAWLKVYRGRHTFRSDQRFRTWLFSVATNAHRDAIRRSGRRVETVALELDAPVAPGHHAERLTLEAAIDALPDPLREAFLLGAVHGFDHREVAEQLGISPDNARARISRARAALRAALGGEA